MKTSTPARSLPLLMATQFQVAFNDNAAKLLLIALAQFPGILPAEKVVGTVSLFPLLLVVPFILFSPVCGWLADRHSKWSVINASLVLQILVMTEICVAVWLRSMPLAILGFFLLACQSTLFSPAKRGIIKELARPGRLGLAVGWMEMLTIAAILVGSFGGGRLFDVFTGIVEDPWKGAFRGTLVLIGLSGIAWVTFLGVARTPAQASDPYTHRLWWIHFRHVLEMWRDRPLFRTALGITYFYFLGGVVYLTLIQAGRDIHGGDVGSGTASGVMLVLLGVGTVAGNLFAGLWCRRAVELGLVPTGCFGLAASLGWLGFSTVGTASYQVALISAGFFSGLFLVPLYAYFQDRAEPSKRGRMLAAVGVLDSLGGVAAVFVYRGMAQLFSLGVSGQFLVLIVPTLAVGLYSFRILPVPVIRMLARLFVRLFYRVRAHGLERIPEGGALLACNHVSYIDAVLLQVTVPRRMYFIGFSGLAVHPLLAWVFRLFDVIPISPRHAAEAVRIAARRLEEGNLVCIFPEGSITRTGSLMGLRKGYEVIARRANVPVVPVFLDSLWGSIFSYSGQRVFWKLPRKIPYPVDINIGSPIPAAEAEPIRLRRDLLDLGEASFQRRPELKGHLARECVRTLAKRPWRMVMVDCSGERREMRAGMLLAVAWLLAERLRREISEKRVGIVLPPGVGALVANLAVVLAGKIPANLNFTVGSGSVQACYRIGDIRTLLSAQAMKDRFEKFPWLDRTLDLRELILNCGKPAILARLAQVWLLPGAVIASRLGLPRIGDNEEAGLLFTSGSSGEPKGVPLTHRNILANISQIVATGVLPRNETVLACLPIFHSMGFTITVWYPLLKGVRLVGLPSPLDSKKVAETVHREKVSIFLSTPTFIRPLLKKATPEQLAPLKILVSGAEKLPLDLYQAFLDRFGIPILQGYGLTETTPVTNVNLPDSPGTKSGHSGQRLGSVGRMLPGLTARIRHPETNDEMPLDQPGIICFKGANVFNGYLDDPEKTAQALRDGWFHTGDIGRFDEDGFLYIEGRLSRFSKIGGEMVPHGTIEQKLSEAFQWDPGEGLVAVVVGIPDEAKGEAIVLVTTKDLSVEQVREKLVQAGLSNLWIPRMVCRVDSIPVLGSGKCDLKKCQELAINITS